MNAVKQCERCGKSLPAARPRLYSSHTHTYYCADIDVCARRAKRQQRAQQLALKDEA